MHNAIYAGLAGVGLLIAGPATATATDADMPDDPVSPPATLALFDQPIRVTRQRVKRQETGVVRCYDYATFRVKELDYGDHGDDAISVTPAHGPDIYKRPACGKQDDPGEVVLKTGNGSYFIGAKAEFIYLVSTFRGDEGGQFWVQDGRTGQVVYTDVASGDPKNIEVDGEKLTLTYDHSFSGDCSILTDGQACWDSIVKRKHLPAAIAKLPAPVAACQAGYANEPRDTSGGNVFAYQVTVRVEQGSKPVVMDRGALICFPPG